MSPRFKDFRGRERDDDDGLVNPRFKEEREGETAGRKERERARGGADIYTESDTRHTDTQ